MYMCSFTHMYIKYRLIKLVLVIGIVSLMPLANADGITQDKDKHIYLDIIIGLKARDDHEFSKSPTTPTSLHEFFDQLHPPFPHSPIHIIHNRACWVVIKMLIAKYCCPFVLLQLQFQDRLSCFHVPAINFCPKSGIKIIIEAGILHYI